MVIFIKVKNTTLNNLIRQTNGNPIIKEIDGLRAIAIIAVLLSHFNLCVVKLNELDETFLYSNPLSRFLELCGNGVSIFFCISAFILSIPFIKYYLYNGEKVSLKKYYVKRITRLQVPYLLVLTALWLTQLLLMNEDFRESVPHYFASFFYSHNIIYGRRSTINPIAWTLEIEIQFYLLLPLLIKIFLIKKTLLRRIFILSIVLLAGILYAYFNDWFIAHHLQFSIFAYLPVFGIGFLLADLYLSYYKKTTEYKQIWLDAFVPLGFALIIYCNGDTRLYMQLLEYAGYILLFIGVFYSQIFNKLFTKKWIMLVGCMCYSIYLLHYAILYFIMNKFSIQFIQHNYYYDLLLQALIVLPIVFVVCTLFYKWIELPFARRKIRP